MGRRLALCAWLACTVALDVGCATTQTPAEPGDTAAAPKRGKRKKPRRPPPVVAEAPEPPAPVDGAADAPHTEAPPDGEAAWEEGMASFYADMLAGNRTANGERYRIDRRTCAHRTLPFGTLLEVQAVDSGRTTTCRVNDRGPFAKGRVLDVSKKCARELDMIAPGVVRVRYRATQSGDVE